MFTVALHSVNSSCHICTRRVELSGQSPECRTWSRMSSAMLDGLILSNLNISGSEFIFTASCSSIANSLGINRDSSMNGSVVYSCPTRNCSHSRRPASSRLSRHSSGDAGTCPLCRQRYLISIWFASVYCLATILAWQPTLIVSFPFRRFSGGIFGLCCELYVFA
ncbi:hypothetical protein BZA70DRAFT_284290 [Myxozyma melibiosi]|uniref:Uncharacterized protein n=1 Tax=Myxozyma melibiosi TaxID=54550 RepID=A0ABR1EZ67_9ASCO